MDALNPDCQLGRLLAWAEANEASDLHGQAGKPFRIRQHGCLSTVPDAVQPAPSLEEFSRVLEEAWDGEFVQRVAANRELDLGFQFRENRYRANFSKQRGLQSFSFRIVPQQRMRLEELRLPSSLRQFLDQPRGILLITGPTGQGKSTTARALIQEMNETQALRVVTIEDPIEYVFQDEQCQFEQREVGIDTESFERGIRNAMRQDPDVLFIGEIRDRESIFAAIQAAETGHLVLTTLHAESVAQAIGRIREYFPAQEQDNISSLLARNILGIVNQRLLPNRDGTRTPCVELMKKNFGVEAAIRANQLDRLTGIIERAVGEGMHSFDQYLFELLAGDFITDKVARRYAAHPGRLEMKLRGIDVPETILDREHY